MPDASSRAVSRIVRDLAANRGQLTAAELPDILAELPGADLATLLLEVFRRRAGRLSAADVMRRYRTDRFVGPGSVDFAALSRAQDAMLAAFGANFDIVVLAPVLPLGSHSVTARVDQRNVIATIRGSEVAADPTNGLALEAAVRRRRLLDAAPRSARAVRLAAAQRVTRAQLFSGPVSFAHFQLVGVVTAGRDSGSLEFERQHLAEHLRLAVRGLSVLGADAVSIAITCLDGPSSGVLAAVREEFAGVAGVEVVPEPERAGGRGYYQRLCFKIFARFGAEEPLEVADGGFVDWTAQLLGSAKERLLISGYGIDRLAIAATAAAKASPLHEPRIT